MSLLSELFEDLLKEAIELLDAPAPLDQSQLDELNLVVDLKEE